MWLPFVWSCSDARIVLPFFFSLLSGQSLVVANATLHNAIAQTSSAAAAVVKWEREDVKKKKMWSAASRHYWVVTLELVFDNFEFFFSD